MATIYKRGKVWYSALRIQGKLVRKALSTDRRIAEEKLAEMVKQRAAGRYGHRYIDISWQDFRDKYLHNSLKTKRNGSYRHDRAAVLALERVFIPRKVSQVGPEVLEALKGDLMSRGLAPGTTNRWLRAINTMLRKAVEWGYANSGHPPSVKLLKESRGRIHFFTGRECGRIIASCYKTDTQFPWLWKTIVLLGIRAGLRRGEIYWLSWQDMDWERKRINISPKSEWAPKDFETRWIPMSDDLSKHLFSIRKNIFKHKEPKWVIEIPDYGRPTLGSITTVIHRIINEAGLSGSAHTLRHTFASHLAIAGVPLYTISKLLGHSSVKQTEVYAHLQPETYEDAISKLPSI